MTVLSEIAILLPTVLGLLNVMHDGCAFSIDPKFITSARLSARSCRDCFFGQVSPLDEKNNSDESSENPFPVASSMLRRYLSFATISGITKCTLSSQMSHALSPLEASSSYDSYANTYDELDGGPLASALGIESARTDMISRAKGDVLEVGAGTGLNLDRYNFGKTNGERVTSLTLVDISEGMLNAARKKVERLGLPIPIKYVKLDATSELVKIFGRESFDTVVDTFSFCVMGEQGASNCVKQMIGVVKGRNEGGQILLLENSRSSNSLLGWYQDFTAEAAASIGGKGCVYNQVRVCLSLMNG
uniref:Methyltransferase domain-containing protein n=1 Tax=Corethron hystrix TaxID=216773 RepID=A0A7S1FY51_9STRA